MPIFRSIRLYTLYTTAYGFQQCSVQHCKRELCVSGWFHFMLFVALCNCWLRLCCMLCWVPVLHDTCYAHCFLLCCHLLAIAVILLRQEMFLFSKRPARLYGPTSGLQYIPASRSPGIKRLGRGTNHLLQYSAKFKNEWRYTFTPPACLKGVDSEIFTFTSAFCMVRLTSHFGKKP